VTDLFSPSMIDVLSDVLSDAPPVVAAAAAVPLAIGIAVRSRAAMSAGLVLVVLAAACLGLVALAGGTADPAATTGVVRGVAVGEVPADDLLPMMIYGSGAAAAVVLGLVSVMPKYDRGLTAVVLCAALACGAAHVSAAGRADAPAASPGAVADASP